MRLITFTRAGSNTPEIGARLPNPSGDHILPFADVAKQLGLLDFPTDMRAFLGAGVSAMEQAKAWVQAAKEYSQLQLDSQGIHFLPPVMNAEKFLCVGKNYRTHLEELKRTNLIKEIPQEPTSFIKLNSCLSGHEAKVVRPKGITRLDYEPELVFVIGKRALGAKKEEAMDYVAGVTILNDLTCRDLQLREVASGSRFWTGKNIPGFGPLGPEIVTIDEIPDPYDLWMTCSVNGEERMRVNTKDQIWKISDILEHFSRFIPIEPGDMFSTGAPGGVAVGKENAEELYLKPGDVVECSIDSISTLRTTIIE
ncbi:fumarylacetoacetate hydrolase family protein [Polynucleobacter alcilacus]|jgi:5-carboxymethyl-2-hydroxymuconate isomerase/acylpyruvate hydrolase|uniref:fumarylacetoacetate hydrolase family protein n=1 Tax=Polynucleobacter alcilacus TaxID=1819739 RepID=UPI001C0AEF0D|nr:fumarylacetoacetate hydrolase family protein [Polynucleobacter alcilacus]MBU3567147.1 fumarylacetoacetate hydrolase family protein [Polynucleobacter alcilacus]